MGDQNLIGTPLVVGAAVDWCTVTTNDDGEGERWWLLFDRYVDKVSKTELKASEWRNKWYTGRMCGGVMWGQSHDQGFIMIAQGPRASELWAKMVPRVRGKVTRIDLQVTVKLHPVRPDVVTSAYDESLKNKARTSTMIRNSRDGQTVYIGSRNSDQFGRVYDKGVKSQIASPGELWRYECQLGKPRSNFTAERLYDLIKKDEMEPKLIQSFVYDWFYNRGIRPEFDKSGDAFVVEVEKIISTKDKQLAWLRSQVSPTVQRLIAQGHGKDVMEALGVGYDQLEMMAYKTGRDIDKSDLSVVELNSPKKNLT